MRKKHFRSDRQAPFIGFYGCNCFKSTETSILFSISQVLEQLSILLPCVSLKQLALDELQVRIPF